LNQIPAPLIKRVEVLTGGAGAVYGADAVAGVVNFIMNDRFEGVQIELNGSGYNHKQQDTAGVADLIRARAAGNSAEFKVPGDVGLDGRVKDVNMLMGGNFADNKGNATIFLSYKKEDAVLAASRDFTACALASSAAGFSCGGSGTSATGRFTNATTGNVYTVTDAAGTARLYNNAIDQYNFGPINQLLRPDERYAVATSVHYDLNEHARVYADFNYHNDSGDAQTAPGGLFGALYPIRYDNPLLSQSLRNALGLTQLGQTTNVVIQRRNVEGGGRDLTFSNTSFRSLIGVKGDLGKWNYDVFAQTAKVSFEGGQDNYFSSSRAAKALDVVNVNGRAVCRSVVNGTDPNCVPYNPWSLGAITPQQLAYLQIPAQSQGSTQQQIQGANIGSDLGDYGIKMPMAISGVGVSFGLERRVEKLDLNPDSATQSGDLAGANAIPAQHGQYVVKDLFGEVRVPLIEGKQFAELLSVNGSYRHSDIDTGVKANTYGIGLEWAPVSQVRFRGSYQKAVRAPNIIEMFAPSGQALFNMPADPCGGATPTATAAQCALTSVTAAQYGHIQNSPAGQYNSLVGGNPNLNPETAKSTTLGMVFTPMTNLAFTVDYYDIRVTDTIGTITPTTILAKCLSTGNPIFCGAITRDSLGTLWLLPQAQVVSTNVNIGSTTTSGVDLGANYSHKLDGYGSVGLAMSGTYLRKFEIGELPGAGTYDCAGLYDGSGHCGQPRPVWRHKFRASWNTPWNVDLAATWRHFNGVKLETTSDNPLLTGIAFPVEASLPSMNYLDLAASWKITKKISLSGGINNLFDKDPPITTQTGNGVGNGNTFPSMYDALGRKFFLNLTAKY
jgi:outer membrane receptor protein involved in Fe transport